MEIISKLLTKHLRLCCCCFSPACFVSVNSWQLTVIAVTDSLIISEHIGWTHNKKKDVFYQNFNHIQKTMWMGWQKLSSSNANPRLCQRIVEFSVSQEFWSPRHTQRTFNTENIEPYSLLSLKIVAYDICTLIIQWTGVIQSWHPLAHSLKSVCTSEWWTHKT